MDGAQAKFGSLLHRVRGDSNFRSHGPFQRAAASTCTTPAAWLLGRSLPVLSVLRPAVPKSRWFSLRRRLSAVRRAVAGGNWARWVERAVLFGGVAGC